MTSQLSSGTIRRIAALFPEVQQAEVARLLMTKCGKSLPFRDMLGATGRERVQFAVLKISGGSMDRLVSAVELAQSDWRDAIVGAGFEDDLSAHSQWLANVLNPAAGFSDLPLSGSLA